MFLFPFGKHLRLKLLGSGCLKNVLFISSSLRSIVTAQAVATVSPKPSVQGGHTTVPTVLPDIESAEDICRESMPARCQIPPVKEFGSRIPDQKTLWICGLSLPILPFSSLSQVSNVDCVLKVLFILSESHHFILHLFPQINRLHL